MSVTRFGVSLLNVVATIESPASHHGTERPEAKNSEVFLPDLLPKKRAGAKQMPTARRAMIQSSALSCIGQSCGFGQSSEFVAAERRLNLARPFKAGSASDRRRPRRVSDATKTCAPQPGLERPG